MEVHGDDVMFLSIPEESEEDFEDKISEPDNEEYLGSMDASSEQALALDDAPSTSILRKPNDAILLLTGILLLGAGIAVGVFMGTKSLPPLIERTPSPTIAPTVAPWFPSSLRVWWHESSFQGLDSDCPIPLVRQSPLYQVHVSFPGSSRVKAFTYVSVPADGVGHKVNLTMNWASFSIDASNETLLYIDVERVDGRRLNSKAMIPAIVRPTVLAMRPLALDDFTIRIEYNLAQNPVQFSVEFPDDVLTWYNDGSEGAGELVTSGNGEKDLVHSEPQHSLMVFVNRSPQYGSPVVPGAENADVLYLPAGDLRSTLSNENYWGQSTLVFGPGVHFHSSANQVVLPPEVNWIHILGGSVLKAAVAFTAQSQEYKVTGFGIITGEGICPPASDDLDQFPASRSCNLELIKFNSTSHKAKILIYGITLANAPGDPFGFSHSMTEPKLDIQNFKQVGGWASQTGEVELFRGSLMRDSFIHSNGDTLKLYHSQSRASNIVIWKAEHGSVLQFGWSPRNITSVVVEHIHLIHNRMFRKAQHHNDCVVNFAKHRPSSTHPSFAEGSTTISNITVRDVQVEGELLCAFRLYLLSNVENFVIEQFAVEAWNGLDAAAQASKLEIHSDGDATVSLGSEGKSGLTISGYTVGGELVTKAKMNYGPFQLGRLDFDQELFENWSTGEDA